MIIASYALILLSIVLCLKFTFIVKIEVKNPDMKPMINVMSAVILHILVLAISNS